MGGSKDYLIDGGFDKQTYQQSGTTYNGIKILEKKDGLSSNLPMFSNTPYTIYASVDRKTGKLKQLSAYGGKEGREKYKDIDWGHPHKEFKKGEIHVHLYENGHKTDRYRKASKKEKRLVKMAIYGRR